MYESSHTQSCVSPVVHTLSSLMICLCLACSSLREAAVPCPEIEISAVADTQADSTKTVALNDATTILISRTPLVATGDITGATASAAGDHWILTFTVSDAAAKRVHEYTKAHVGKDLASVVDGKVYGTPRITGAIVGNAYRIEDIDRTEAERLASAISNGCHH